MYVLRRCCHCLVRRDGSGSEHTISQSASASSSTQLANDDDDVLLLQMENERE